MICVCVCSCSLYLLSPCRVASPVVTFTLIESGMCKKHWNEVHKPPPPVQPEVVPPHPQGQSVYDQIIPASVAWKAVKKRTVTGTHVTAAEAAVAVHGADHLPALPGAQPEVQPGIVSVPAGPAMAEVVEPMPIVSHLKTNAHLPAGWHRQQERR